MKYNFMITRTEENTKHDLNVYDALVMIDDYIKGKIDMSEVVAIIEYLKEQSNVKDR
ncbi:MAG: hypothetical protein IKO45_04935 [Clostridia bacterium]|nr:hypothetical protein [Clostridia bacterium]MBR4623879.1 hypothetical protein [Clostridia bacterium]